MDTDKLSGWLSQHGLHGPIAVEPFPHGFSNLTYGIECGDRHLVLRRPPVGSKVRSAHDVAREYRILAALYPIFHKVPRPVALCEDDSVLGAPFYVMERVDGIILRDRAPQGVDLSPAVMRRLSEAFVDTLADIHAVDLHATGLDALARGDGYVERQITGWTERYRKSQTDDVPQVDLVSKWLADHLPPDSGTALIHNDFKYDNLVLDPNDLGRPLAVLDWEMATVGDPLMDLGTSLGYWVQADDPPAMRMMPFTLTALPGNLTRDEIWQRYVQKTTLTDVSPTFYYVYGLFKIAVVAQQIYYRYKQGLTRDPRFARLLDAVRVLADQAWRSASGSA